jgi:Sulfatase
MTGPARHVHALAAAILPALVTGSLYLPDTPPPVDRMVRLTAIALIVAVTCMLLPGRRAGSPTFRTVAFSLSIAMALAYPLVSSLVGIHRLSTADAVFAAAYVVAAVAALRHVYSLTADALGEMRSTLNLVMPIMVLTVWAWSWHGYAFGPRGPWREVVKQMAAPVRLGPPRNTDPDIVHVILDGMGRADVLKAKFGVDIGPELSRLAAGGLRISPDATANYPQTYLSLASTLNMRDLQPLADVLGDSPHRGPLIYLIQHSAVITSLKDRGYAFTFIGSSYAAATGHRLADDCECDAMPFGEFEGGLLAITPGRGLPYNHLMYGEHRNEIRMAFARLRALSPRAGRQMVLAHVLVPHPPFVLGPAGDLPDPPQGYALLDGSHFKGTHDEYRAGYARQAAYAAQAVAQVVSVLHNRWASAARPVLVIVQGDHGPGMDYDVADVRRTDAQERLAILLAVSWPGVSDDEAPALRSPVNTYRAIFNQYFSTHLPMLPDRSYLATFDHPYRLVPTVAVGP